MKKNKLTFEKDKNISLYHYQFNFTTIKFAN